MSEGVCCFRHVGMSAHTYVKYAKDKTSLLALPQPRTRIPSTLMSFESCSTMVLTSASTTFSGSVCSVE